MKQDTVWIIRSLMALLIVAAWGVAPAAASGTTRIKDIVDIETVRANQMVGYGLVVGLNGSGDNLSSAPFTEQSMLAMLERLGVNVRQDGGATTGLLKSKNVAAVMVTADLPPFTPQGTRIDVTISTLGDATSLEGGTLLVTSLMGADGKVYAVAQGPISIAGFSARGETATVTRNIPTKGRIAEGAIVEREIDFNLADLQALRLTLKNPDFTTARRIAHAINGFTSADIALAENGTTVRLTMPANYPGSIVDLVTDVEQLPVQPDQTARVVIDESSGTIVMGSDVKVNTVAIAQGSLTIKITNEEQVSQPSPFAQVGTTEKVTRSTIDVNTGADQQLAVLEGNVTLQDLVAGLNRLGVGPRDIITILQAIKTAGALQAEIVTM